MPKIRSNRKREISDLTKDILFDELADDGITISNRFLQQAKSGNCNALLHIAYKYDTKNDSYKSFAWSLLAAVKEQPEAQFKIAFMLHIPKDTTILIDHHNAMEWYLEAARNGNMDAFNNIGAMYRFGHGVPKNYKIAIKWFLKAHENKVAQFNIAQMYERGVGVEKNIKKAVNWYRKSADQGYLYATESLKRLTVHVDMLDNIHTDFHELENKLTNTKESFNHVLDRLTDLELYFKKKIEEIDEKLEKRAHQTRKLTTTRRKRRQRKEPPSEEMNPMKKNQSRNRRVYKSLNRAYIMK